MNMPSEYSHVTLVSGSWPPAICGVGDFMHRTWEELNRSGHAAEKLTLERGDLSASLRAWATSFRRDRLVYVSYPTEGYGKSLLPFLLALGDRRKVVLHMHEYRSKNRYCRFLLRRFQRMHRLFFSNREDYQRYVSDCGLSADSPKVAGWRVVPTPSNIPVTVSDGLRNPHRVKIVHFGQIRPLKGLEDLVKVMEALQNEPVERVVLGGVPKGYESYAREITQRFAQSGVTVKLNLTPEEISQQLASSHVGLFAFPDGADERRGSLIAAMAHGVLCVTTHSGRTPQPLRSATIGVEVEDGPVAEELAIALRRAVYEANSAGNRERVELSRQIGVEASFRGLVEQLLETEHMRPSTS